MDAMTKIKNNLDVVKILEYYKFEHINDRSRFIRACCKIHGGDNPTSFVIDKDSGLWNCHVCGEKGDIFKLPMKLDNTDFVTAVRKIAGVIGISINGLEVIMPTNDVTRSLKDFVRIMNKNKKEKFDEYELPEGREIASYRGFGEFTLQHFNVQYVENLRVKKRDSELHYSLRNRVVFPIVFQGKTIGYSARRTVSTEYAKWIHQPNEIKTGNILYNYDNILESEVVVVCEGIMDVIACWEVGIDAVCSFGSSLSDEQINLLLMLSADIVMCYDADEAGQKGINKAKEKLTKKTNLFIMELPVGQDPASISGQELKQIYNNRRKLR